MIGYAGSEAKKCTIFVQFEAECPLDGLGRRNHAISRDVNVIFRKIPMLVVVGERCNRTTRLCIELFKKSKIIKIGFEVGGFWKISGNPGIFVPEIWGSRLKTVPTIRINPQNSETAKSFLY